MFINSRLSTMNEKILSLLTAKFAQARKDGLQQLARSLSLQVADEAEAQALVEKLTADKVTEFIRDYRREIDSEVSNANKTYDTNLRSKYSLVEKKTPEQPKPDENDISAIIRQSVEAAIKPLQEKIQSFEAGKTTSTRKQTLESKLKNAPEAFRKTILKGFEKMNFVDDEDFTQFVVETEEGLKEVNQEAANIGLSGFPRPATPAGDASKDKVLKDIKEWSGVDKEKTN